MRKRKETGRVQYMKAEQFLQRLPFYQCPRQLQYWSKNNNRGKTSRWGTGGGIYRYSEQDIFYFIIWKYKNNRKPLNWKSFAMYGDGYEIMDLV